MSARPYLFVSDLHLDAREPAAVTQFLAFLATTARTAAALYILGDLFETWIGDDDTEPTRGSVCDALRRYTSSGWPCFVMHGNRDFLLGRGFEQRSGCTLLPDPMLLELGALRAFVSHGDILCTADHSYQAFRSIVRNVDWQARYLRLPLETRRAFANAARKGSKAHADHSPAGIMDVHPDAVASAFKVAGARLIIHGHTHRPAVHRVLIDGQAATRIVLGDWYEQGSYLVLHADGRHELIALPRHRPGGGVDSV
jgi:UDP-2,3-diacylglucosamine hydrolase